MADDEYRQRWDSLLNGYLPGRELHVRSDVQLNAEQSETDAVTFEVLRSRLWSINSDHQETIRRISGSGVTVYCWDFNVSILTEDGDGVVFGPGILFFAGFADCVVRWTLEHRSDIRPGDVFLQNDPWVGTNHQMDAAVYAPVFVNDEIFAWVFNVVHQQEVGGVEPGGFVQQARDAYWEATTFPPIKLLDRGEWREDVVDAWIRRSRVPQLCHLELKSQVAGVELARSRVTELIESYGAPLVKGVMRRMITNAERAVRDRLSSVPTGTWRDERYCAGALPGDRDLYRLVLTVEKNDETLIFSNEGTDSPSGSFNISPGNWRAILLSAVLQLIAYDQYLCGAGVLRCMEFRPSIGTIMSAQHPAAVSTSLGTSNALAQAQYLISKMLGSSEECRPDMVGASALHSQIYTQMFGTDQFGKPYANFPFDGLGGGSGACSFRDGLDHAGGMLATQLRIGNVEEWERVIPFLYLYRREVTHGGGHGRWRGGSGIVAAWTGYDTDASYIASGGVAQAVTQGKGLSGGFPGSGGSFWAATDIGDPMAGDHWPATPEELRAAAPNGASPPPKKFDNRLARGDVFEVMTPLAAGHGDPILRDVERVRADVRESRLSVEAAERLYGVVLQPDGTADEVLTGQRRAEILRARLHPRPDRHNHRAPPGARSLGYAIETVEILEADGELVLACGHCRQILGCPDKGYRTGCEVVHLRLPEIDQGLFADPLAQVDQDVVLRQFVCGSCGVCLDTDICCAGDPVYQDVAISTPAG